MAMSKEEQRASAERIMEKTGLLDPQEQQTYDLLARKIEDYIPPSPDGERVCGVCGEVFQNLPNNPALEQFSDHQTQHNPTAGQWGEAHRRIQAAREARKGQDG